MRILLAEDEKSLSRALTKILENSNYAVDAVYDGEEALDYLRAGGYDAVILDVMMPKRDGFEVLRELRSTEDNTPVIMLTARSEIDDKVAGLDLGANDYLTKPFDPRELLARIRTITRSQTGSTDSNLRVGNMVLDRVHYRLTCAEQSLDLANREFQMLEMLMSNEGQVIPTERLFSKIWGLDSDSDISIVWVYISNLRKKLRFIGADVKIKATRNVGYSLVPDDSSDNGDTV